MRPFLLFCPGGAVPEGVRAPLERAGSDVIVASTVDEAASMAASARPEIVLVVPPGTVADGAALLLSRVQFTGLLDLWEHVAEGTPGFVEHALRSLSLSLDASRVTLYRWKAGSPHATVEGSSLGPGVVGHHVEIARYPELRAAARSGVVLVEEVERDPLMEDARAALAGGRTRSLLCRVLPGSGSDLYVHAVRDTVPFGLVDVALVAAMSRILHAFLAASRRPESPEKGPDRKRQRTVQRILTGIPDATAVVGPSGEILLVNPPFCALTGRLDSELVGLDVGSLLRPLAPEDTLAVPVARPGPPVAATRARLVTAAGETIPVEALSLPTPDETAGRAGWFTLTLRDRRPEDTREAREQALVRELDETSRQLEAFQRGVRLHVEVPKGLPRIAGDREKVERLVTNLVDHSLRRVPRGDSDVRVVAATGDGRALVKVVDRAPTLSPERTVHLFDDVGGARGVGEFGLSVARRLADAMDADLMAYADTDGSNVKCVAWRLAEPVPAGPKT